MNIDGLRLAEITEIDELSAIYSNCKEALLAEGILQWGEWGGGYPDRSFIELAVAESEMYIYTLNRNPAGAVVLNGKQSAEWQTIKWDESIRKPVVLHGLVIAPEYQGRGCAKSLLNLCESLAVDRNHDGIRLDAFSKNLKSNRLYLHNGYIYRGTVLFPEKPENNREYYCYEKPIR